MRTVKIETESVSVLAVRDILDNHLSVDRNVPLTKIVHHMKLVDKRNAEVLVMEVVELMRSVGF